MFDKDITVVNKITTDDGKLVYKTSHIKGFWSTNKGISLSGVNLIKTDGLTCRILMSEQGYVEPNQYESIGWTLRNDDYLIKGIVDEVSSIAEMKENYETMKITSIAVKDYGSKDMWHFEINGD